MTLLLFVLGLILLMVGAEALVRGASRLATALRISPLVIGLTVVAFGTSTPELAVSVHSSLAGRADIAVGNVVGSNICNVLLILGLSALITPLIVSQQLVRRDVPLMIGASLLTWLFAMDGRIARGEGMVLFAGILAYTLWAVWRSRRESAAVQREYADAYAEVVNEGATPASPLYWAVQVGLVVGGLALLVLGARWLVESATQFATALGVSPLLIGLTIVALGTSLPEVATSVVASIRGERDIAVGNVVGSNLFNLLAVLGATGVVAPNGIAVSTAAIWLDIPIMIGAAVACLPIFFTGRQIARWEGVLFLGYYCAYLAFLALGATANELLPLFSGIMLFLVIPITVIALLYFATRDWRAQLLDMRV